jgi:hypothetical protein
MPGHNPLMGYAPSPPQTFVGVGAGDSDTMAAHPLIGGPAADASEMVISRRAGAIVALAVVTLVLVHLGGFRTNIAIGA